ncbi:MAG: copper-translocating P-type ATPase [Cyanobacteria bacterium SW_9_44_58]|nr:MAG: copper-translocating P-type ATPase [Cyanobacteria bacterium SW_9_44_58]
MQVSSKPSSELRCETPQTITLDVDGMKCAGCVNAVERQIEQRDGVIAAQVNLITATAVIQYEPDQVNPDEIASQLTAKGFPSQRHNTDQDSDTAASYEEKRQQADRENFRKLAIAGVLIILSGLGHLKHFTGLHIPLLSNIGFHWGLATLALILPGREIIVDGAKGLWNRVPNMNSLIALGTVSAYLASCVALLFPQLGWECFFDEPVMLLGFILLGRTLEQRARGEAGAALSALISLKPQTARLVKETGNQQEKSMEVPVTTVQSGQWLRVLPGEKMPVDGEILKGETTVDESMLTGESVPVTKQPQDTVKAGTINLTGAITLKATQVGQNTTLAQIIASVENAQTRKAPVQKLADQVAGYFAYGVMTVAALTFLFWYFVGTNVWTQLTAETSPLLLSLKLMIAVLVIACPCALGLATPTAILVGTGIGAKQGLLLKGGDVLEKVHRLKTLVFDKTGTLTEGEPKVTDVWVAATPDINEDTLLQLAASAEQGTNHPLANAIVAAAQEKGVSLLPTTHEETKAGFGVTATIEEQQIAVGNANWLQDNAIALPNTVDNKVQELERTGKTVVYAAINGSLAGLIACEDCLRPEAKETVSKLQNMGFQVMLLTGDNQRVASAIAQQLNLPTENVFAEVHPEEKAQVIQSSQKQGRVGMIGDGINDAPALAQADVGIAIAQGTEVALETASILLMRDRVWDIIAAVRLSFATLNKIRQNLFWALGYNVIAIPLAAGVLLPKYDILLSPAIAAGFMALSSVIVVTNSLPLKRQAI